MVGTIVIIIHAEKNKFPSVSNSAGLNNNSKQTRRDSLFPFPLYSSSDNIPIWGTLIPINT